MTLLITTVLASVVLVAGPLEPPVVVVDRDNVEITESCIVEIRTKYITDDDDNGVIHILADDITVEFSDEHRDLIAYEKGTPWDTIRGIGIRIDSHKNVTIKNAHVHRFKVGILATQTDGLVLENCDLAGGYQMHLKSTPKAEDGSDWLWPHNNDNNEWMHNYGAAVYVENSKGITIADCFSRRRQNGIVLDHVTDSKIYDNDFSFLSGWGLAMWRSSRNIITRNAFDFCVRGYSHDVYNRGQDSAGILMFEQNNDNIIAENSVTHGGDGLFGFGGRDSLGEHWLIAERDRLKKETGKDNVDDMIVFPPDLLEKVYRSGNNRNIIIDNDFSFAPAHGIEMTFSFDNEIIGNLMEKNAICGIWGGYSQDTLIADNDFIQNGDYGYGLERGGVNIEHGRGNIIVDNHFVENKCGIHLWWDPDDGMMVQPWAKINHHDKNLKLNDDGSIALTARPEGNAKMLPSAQNIIVGNSFDGDKLALHLRDSDTTMFANNTLSGVEKDIDAVNSSVSKRGAGIARWQRPKYPVLGKKYPIGARAELRGRDKIIITEWGPYDWSGPYLQQISDEDGAHVYRLLGKETSTAATVEGDVVIEKFTRDGLEHFKISPARENELLEYGISVATESATITKDASIGSNEWSITVFDYTSDPRTEEEAWNLEAVKNAVSFKASALSLPYGMSGPSQLADVPQNVKNAGIGGNHFGTIAHTNVILPVGKWKITTSSDDGIRVWINDELVINDWTWHGPKRNDAVFEIQEKQQVTIKVKHFELDGFAVLEVDLESVN